MKRMLSTLFALGLTISAAGSAFAQDTNDDSNRTPVVRHRQKHQQKRIYRGVKSGELTKGETLRLRDEQRDIRQEKREAKADGDVTGRERAHLHRELNQSSRHIYRAKHNRRDRN